MAKDPLSPTADLNKVPPPSMPPNAAHVEDDYFNDLSRQPHLPTAGNANAPSASDGNLNREDASLPRQKRVACVICRKRKLKCDGNRPSCGTCARLGHNCAYDEVRRKSGPKRGYVKELEARLGMILNVIRESSLMCSSPLAQVETQLKKDVPSPPAPPSTNAPAIPATTAQNTTSYTSYDVNAMNVDMAMPMDGLLNTNNNFEASPSANVVPDIDLAVDENFTWEMIGLGLEEPLPTQEAVDEL